MTSARLKMFLTEYYWRKQNRRNTELNNWIRTTILPSRFLCDRVLQFKTIINFFVTSFEKLRYFIKHQLGNFGK